jgi:hypothetical protein
MLSHQAKLAYFLSNKPAKLAELNIGMLLKTVTFSKTTLMDMDKDIYLSLKYSIFLSVITVYALLLSIVDL